MPEGRKSCDRRTGAGLFRPSADSHHTARSSAGEGCPGAGAADPESRVDGRLTERTPRHPLQPDPKAPHDRRPRREDDPQADERDAVDPPGLLAEALGLLEPTGPPSESGRSGRSSPTTPTASRDPCTGCRFRGRWPGSCCTGGGHCRASAPISRPRPGSPPPTHP